MSDVEGDGAVVSTVVVAVVALFVGLVAVVVGGTVGSCSSSWNHYYLF
jgi:hypothetical protein